MSLSILTWNINGLRAAINKGFWNKISDLKPDIICLQEIKIDDLTMKSLVTKDQNFGNWELIWHSAVRKGYSGTMILVNKKILKKEFQKETPNLLFQHKSEDIFDLQEEILDLESYNKKIQKLNSEIKSFENKEIQPNIQPNQIKILEKIVGIDNEFFDVEGRVTGIIFELKSNLCNEFCQDFCSDSRSDKTENLKSKPNLENLEEILKKSQLFLLLNCYYPQGGRGGERIEYKREFYKEVLEFVRRKKLKLPDLNVILTGDFNTTFADIDLKRPKENRQTTGCLPIEREVLNLLCTELDLVDIFRQQNPELQLFTYWDQITRARERNVGWRIDFFLVSKCLTGNFDENLENLKDLENENLEIKSAKLTNLKTCKIEIMNHILGSDHCPVWLEII